MNRSRQRRPTTPIRARHAIVHTLEPRCLLTAAGTLAPVVQFNGTNGVAPQAAVMDTSGDIFGITYDSTVAGVTYGPGQHGPGEVFEVPAGTQAIDVLATFSQDAYVGTSLVIDSKGDLFGTESPDTSDGGSGLPTIIFEMPVGITTPTTIATVPAGTSGAFTLTAADPSGNVFGISTFNGPFEVVSGSNAVTHLASQSSGSPIDASDLYVASNGNIYGTTYAGGDNGEGSLFELAAGTLAYTQLASFNSSTTGSKPLGVVADSAGNLFGFCENGGPNGSGTVFELAAGSSTIALLAMFTTATGDTPISRPVLGSSGTLYGLTDSDGANGFGSFFSVATPDATSDATIDTESVGIPGSEGNDSTITPLDGSTSSNVNDLVDFDGSEEAGQGTAGVVTGSDPGNFNDINNTSINLWGGQYGTSSNRDSVGGSGGLDTYTPRSALPPSVPTLNNIKQALDKLKNAEDTRDEAYKDLQRDVELGDNPNSDQYKELEKEFRDTSDAYLKAIQDAAQATQGVGQYNAAQSQIQSLSGNSETIVPLASGSSGIDGQLPAAAENSATASSTAKAKKLAAEEALVAKLGPKIIADYDAILGTTTTIQDDTASIDAFIATLPTAPILTVSVAKDTLPAAVSAGSKLHARLTLTLSNSGARAKGHGTVTLYASPTPTLTGATPIGAPKSVTISVNGLKAQTLLIPIPPLSQSLAAGTYYLIAQVIFGAVTIAPTAASQTFIATQSS